MTQNSCTKCGSDIQNSDDEFCRNCGADLKGKENNEQSLPITQSHRIPVALIVVFLTSLFIAMGTGTFDIIYFIFIILLGGFSIYFVYREETSRFQYIKYLGFFFVILGILYFIGGLTYDTSDDAVVERIIYSPYPLGAMDFAIQQAHDIAYKNGLLLEGVIIVVFGLLLYWEVTKRLASNQDISLGKGKGILISKIGSKKEKQGAVTDKQSKPYHIILIIIAFVIVSAILLVGSFFSGFFAPTSDVNPTYYPTIIPSTNPQTNTSLKCDIVGKWTQILAEETPVTGVYIQIYSDNRIEIYLNNQLRSWGTWNMITPNHFSFTWTGGVDISTNTHTFTVSPDCRTLSVLSFRGEHSTFVRQ